MVAWTRQGGHARRTTRGFGRPAPGWWPPQIAEPAVTLTDYGLAVEAVLMAYRLARRPTRSPALRSSFVLFFGATSLAALAGGTVHGFYPDAETTGHRVLWPVTLGAIGLAALAAWVIGARLAFAPPVAGRLTALATAAFAAYGAVVLCGRQRFSVAVTNYLPAAAFLFIVFARRAARDRERPVLAGLAGIALTGLAAGVQHRRVTPHVPSVDHNTLYHLLQAVALVLFFRSARWLVEQAPASPG